MHTTDEGFICESFNTQRNYKFNEMRTSVKIRHGNSLIPNSKIGTVSIINLNIMFNIQVIILKAQNFIPKLG
jgi:hypothetical protein